MKAKNSDELKNKVYKWLMIKAEHDKAYKFNRLGIEPDKLEQLLIQLAADAAHSELLYRLFEGEEPY